MTPRRLDLRARAYADEREERIELVRVSAYLTALLTSGFVWKKGQKPSYDKVFGRRGEAMSDADMLRVVEGLNAGFGGADARKHKEA